MILYMLMGALAGWLSSEIVNSIKYRRFSRRVRLALRGVERLCPFHRERTPSFNVSSARMGYRCFGCGAGGDAIRFLMDHAGMSYEQAKEEVEG